MKLAKYLLPVLGLTLAAASPGPARPRQREMDLATQHLSSISLLQRWSQAIYRLLPPGQGHCEPSLSDWVDNGDDTYTRVAITADCTRIVTTNYGRFPSDYDQELDYSNGIKEQLRVRTVSRFNNGPGSVRFEHRFSTGDRVEYDQELQQEAAVDASGAPRPGINYWYGLISRGKVRLADGQCLHFELRQTKSPTPYNFLNRTYLREEIRREWFVGDNQETATPKPDRLQVRMDCGRLRGSLEMEVPIAVPGSGRPDFTRNTTGSIVLGGKRMKFKLIPDRPQDPQDARWRYWQTSGAGYHGTFELGTDFSGRGNAFHTRGRVGASASRGNASRRLHFSARWNQQGVGTVILSDGQTLPGGPFGGALDFASLKWSGLASAYGPAPGL